MSCIFNKYGNTGRKNYDKKSHKKSLSNYSYFKSVWQELQVDLSEKFFHHLSSEKGLIPYKKIRYFESLNITPEYREFFEKVEFFSELKNNEISDQGYEDAKLLFKTLKMRKLNDMNDLYNFQGVI